MGSGQLCRLLAEIRILGNGHLEAGSEKSDTGQEAELGLVA